jgi:L,D-peptidoglycan transpeptidase YkuD (ErfK/YbiS/YcfS/YnhG family)
LAHKSEGDGSTPTGTYSIGALMYGVAANPGVAFGYHRLSCGDWWDEAPSSPMYNRFVHVRCGTSPPFGGDSEALWEVVPQYDYFAVIDYNASPIVPGRGSAIFLHVSSGVPTAGCVALPVKDLLETLRWLQPRDHPVIAIGFPIAKHRSQLRRERRSWMVSRYRPIHCCPLGGLACGRPGVDTCHLGMLG